jgi:hypothetical protein
MSQTVLTPITLKENNYAVTAGDLNITLTAMDASNGNSFPATGQEILLFANTDTATHTVTITSTGDTIGRTDSSLTSYTVPVASGGASGISAVQMKLLTGWIQAGSVVYLATSSALVKVAVLRYQ